MRLGGGSYQKQKVRRFVKIIAKALGNTSAWKVSSEGTHTCLSGTINGVAVIIDFVALSPRLKLSADGVGIELLHSEHTRLIIEAEKLARRVRKVPQLEVIARLEKCDAHP